MIDRHILDRTRDGRLPTSPEVIAEVLESLRSTGDDITMAGLRILVSVRNEGSQTVASLAEDLHLRASTIAASCPYLVTRGLVIGMPSNANGKALAIVLSTAGRRLVDNLICWRPSRPASGPLSARPADPVV